MSSIESLLILSKVVLASLLFLLLGAATAEAEAARYGDQATFQTAAMNLGQQDAFYEACHGERPQYRNRYDTLSTSAHPALRGELLGIYDFYYRTFSQSSAAMRGNSCPPAHQAKIEKIAATYFATLEPGGATATPSAAETPTSGTDNSGESVAKESKPASGAFDAAIARMKSHLAECEEIRAQHKPSMNDIALDSEALQKNAKNSPLTFANTCASKCQQAAQQERWKDRPDSPLTQKDFNQYVAACDNSHELAVARNAEVAAATAAEDADREANVASAGGGNPLASIEGFFGQFSDWNIRIEADAFIGDVNVGLARHARFSINDIDAVEYRAGGGNKKFFIFRCRSRANCVRMEDNRGKGPTSRDVHDLIVAVKPSAADRISRETLSSLGIDIERWAQSIGSSVDVSF